MTRFIGAVSALLCFIPAANASLNHSKSVDRVAEFKPALAKGPVLDSPSAPPSAETQLTTETEVFLDGRPCQYKDIPATSSISRMLLAPDRKTILRIEFRSPK